MINKALKTNKNNSFSELTQFLKTFFCKTFHYYEIANFMIQKKSKLKFRPIFFYYQMIKKHSYKPQKKPHQSRAYDMYVKNIIKLLHFQSLQLFSRKL